MKSINFETSVELLGNVSIPVPGAALYLSCCRSTGSGTHLSSSSSSSSSSSCFSSYSSLSSYFTFSSSTYSYPLSTSQLFPRADRQLPLFSAPMSVYNFP